MKSQLPTHSTNGRPWAPAFSKLLFVVLALLFWTFIGSFGINTKVVPDLISVIGAMIAPGAAAELWRHLAQSLYLIGSGVVIGIFSAFVLTTLYMIWSPAADVLDVVIAILHPLPGIALLPIVMLLVGIGNAAIILIIVHSILWPIVVNAVSGFKSVPKTQLELGQNLGMNPARLVVSVMTPNAFPNILAGLKIAWSRSWRALVAAEMVFGATGIDGGLGWFIYKKRYLMEVESVFAGLLVIIFVGLIVDNLVFSTIEKRTVVRWGMSK